MEGDEKQLVDPIKKKKRTKGQRETTGKAACTTKKRMVPVFSKDEARQDYRIIWRRQRRKKSIMGRVLSPRLPILVCLVIN